MKDGVSEDVFPLQRKRESESESDEAVTPPSPATPPPEELSKKEKKKKKKEKKIKEAAESGGEQIDVVCNWLLPWYSPRMGDILSLPNSSRIKTHRHPAVHAPKAPGSPQAEGCLSGCICKQNWLRMVGVDLQCGRHRVSSHLCPRAVGGHMFLPGHPYALVPDMVLALSMPECLYVGEGGLQPWRARTAFGEGLFLLK